MQLTYTIFFVDEKNAIAQDFDDKFDEVKAVINGNIANDNIASDADIDAIKINGTAVTNADVDEANTASKIPKRDSNKNINANKITGADGSLDLDYSGVFLDAGANGNARLRSTNSFTATYIDADGGITLSPAYVAEVALLASLTRAGAGHLKLQVTADDKFEIINANAGGDIVIDAKVNNILNVDGNARLTADADVVTLGKPLILPSLASDPTSGVVDGMIYYNSTSNKIKVRANGAWETVTSA